MTWSDEEDTTTGDDADADADAEEEDTTTDWNVQITTDDEGTETWTYEDGSQVIFYVDGTHVYIEDGITRTYYENGDSLTEYDDGTSVYRNSDGTTTQTDEDGNETTYEAWTSDTVCAAYPEICPNHYPDHIAICDLVNQGILPEELAEGTSFTSGCGIEVEDVCITYPDLCDSDGNLTGEVCALDASLCEETSADYNHCAADLYACLITNDYDPCIDFPELCGYVSTIEVPTFWTELSGKV